MSETNCVPVGQLKTNRGLIKYLLLSLVTVCIYPIVFYSSISTDINIIASRYDGKKTMHFCLLLFIFLPLTLGIAVFIWFHRLSSRIGKEMRRRGLPNAISAGTFWGWNILGSLIIVGPFIYMHKLCRAMNTLSAHYNAHG